MIPFHLWEEESSRRKTPPRKHSRIWQRSRRTPADPSCRDRSASRHGRNGDVAMRPSRLQLASHHLPWRIRVRSAASSTTAPAKKPIWSGRLAYLSAKQAGCVDDAGRHQQSEDDQSEFHDQLPGAPETYTERRTVSRLP